MNRDGLYLERMRDAITKLERFVDDMTMSDFMRDEKTQSAVILQLILIGEMVKRLSAETKT